mgnify:CR=1 FL=1
MNGGEGVTVDVILPMEKAGDDRARRAAVAEKLGISPSRIRELRLVKESIDSRQKNILFQLRLLAGVDGPLPPEEPLSRDYPPVRPGAPVALIVGFGPAGMFAALRCLELGMKPVVLERGKDVSSRRFDLAPAQKVEDFLNGRVSSSLLPTSYHPGITSHPLHELLPGEIVWRMREGLRQFDHKWRGFAGASAQLIGCETRTSSPVRIPRDPATLEHPGLEGLYPCGEGAGYAGGIVSAALDGRRCAEAMARQMSR